MTLEEAEKIVKELGSSVQRTDNFDGSVLLSANWFYIHELEALATTLRANADQSSEVQSGD